MFMFVEYNIQRDVVRTVCLGTKSAWLGLGKECDGTQNGCKLPRSWQRYPALLLLTWLENVPKSNQKYPVVSCLQM